MIEGEKELTAKTQRTQRHSHFYLCVLCVFAVKNPKMNLNSQRHNFFATEPSL
jgi:hypothetical protein